MKLKSIDLSLLFLLFTNVFVIFLALKQGWDVLTLALIYWFQSIAIGIFNFVRILQLKDFSTESLWKNYVFDITTKRMISPKQLKPTPETKMLLAFFFLFHYFGFFLVYLLFLIPFNEIFTSLLLGQKIEFLEKLKYAFLCFLAFFITHLFSYIYNKPRDAKKQNIYVIMFYPYARVLPMHAFILVPILLKTEAREMLLIFLAAKTLADVIMHVVEHSIIRREFS